MKKYLLPIFAIVLVLFFDQWLKYWVHTHIYESHKVIFPNWFLLYYTENNGMAFGVEFGGIAGKIILTIFRILAVFAIVWYIVKQINLKASRGFIVCVSLILAGAVGNIIDSVFYGILYRSQSLPLFQGRVIDMLYFPIIDTYIPDSFPFWKGEHFQFFRPVFNIADASISIGILLIIVFQRVFFLNKEVNQRIPSFNLETVEYIDIYQKFNNDTMIALKFCVVVNIIALISYFIPSPKIQDVISWIQIVTNVLTFIIFIAWFRKKYSNLHSLLLKKLNYNVNMTIWGFFIPVVCFIRPNIIMNEIWMEIQKLKKEIEPEYHKRKTVFINAWWILFILSFIMNFVFSIFSMGRYSEFNSLVNLVFLVSSILVTIGVVRIVSEEEKTLFIMLKEYEMRNRNPETNDGDIDPDTNHDTSSEDLSFEL